MIDDLMGKMEEAQRQMEDAKKRLDSVFVDAEAEGGLVKVRMNGNKKLTEITIADDLMDDNDKEAIEDLVIIAVNRAVDQAEKLSESELGNVAQGFMPDINSLFG